MKDKISVITTFYNAENYIGQAIKSVLCQYVSKIVNIEYIIVDDCSTDNSLNIVKDIISNVKTEIKCKIISPKHNLGCGGARKFGIEHSTGNYIMFLDADDYYINSDFIYRAYTEITENNADIVEFGLVYNTSDGSTANVVADRRYEFTDPEQAVYSIFNENIIKFNAWTKIYRRSIVDSYPYSDTKTYEDIRTIPFWVYNAKKIIVIPSAEVNYRASSKSIIRNNDVETRIGTIKAMTEVCEHFKDNLKIVKALYKRAMIDLCAILDGSTSLDYGFNELSECNTKMLSYIYPDKYKEMTYNVEENNETKDN